MIGLIILIYFGGKLIVCNKNIPICDQLLKEHKKYVKDWEQRCLSESRHEINSPCCKAEKDYFQERMRMHTKMCLYEGSYPEPYLLIRTRTKILATDLATFDTTVVMRSLQYNENEGLDIDTLGKKIYFTNASHIYRANFDGTGKETIVENAGPYDITIDWIGRRIFWTVLESEGKINVASLDGQARRVFVNTHYPEHVKVDPTVGGRVNALEYESSVCDGDEVSADNNDEIASCCSSRKQL
ncbi:Hypothetical predicted protein [Paramuricea clavata]|uniref:Uncharacterized protein n=1 Tax=Paramuricea clavata TaxID=317549 RepID=A0A6S7GVB2_PARCT|nr:Hypothetical predicted protein [Paramuricea clavata]